VIYKEIGKRKVIECEGSMALPEGTSVRMIPEPLEKGKGLRTSLSLKEWQQEAYQVPSQLSTIMDLAVLWCEL
jgi:hypothetical protein